MNSMSFELCPDRQRSLLSPEPAVLLASGRNYVFAHRWSVQRTDKRRRQDLDESRGESISEPRRY